MRKKKATRSKMDARKKSVERRKKI